MATLISIPINIIKFIFKHPKVLVLLIIGVFIFFGFSTCSKITGGNKSAATTPVPAYQLNAPSISDAAYMVQTETRIYYTSKYSGDKSAIVLDGYYEYGKSKWIKQTTKLTLTQALYKGAKVYDRKSNKVLFTL